RYQKYRLAVAYYEHVLRCSVSSGEVLAANDRLDMARCYEWVGKYRRARQVYQNLLAAESVQKDPELLSAVYVRLAMAFHKTSANARIHFQELAIRCLPASSPNLNRRYAQYCSILLRAGHLVQASQAFRQAEDCTLRQNGDLSRLNPIRATLLMSLGDFRSAVRCLLSTTASDPDAATVPINIAYCLENLGDLKTAITYL